MAFSGLSAVGRRIRGFPSRLVGRIPWLRRRYVRRILRSIDKARDKKRPMPDNLVRLDRMLRRVPRHKRAETLEQMLEAGAAPETELNRAVRRAASRQERRSGKGAGLRPGMGPGQRVEQRRR